VEHFNEGITLAIPRGGHFPLRLFDLAERRSSFDAKLGLISLSDPTDRDSEGHKISLSGPAAVTRTI
jgi:hypothetical protein